MIVYEVNEVCFLKNVLILDMVSMKNIKIIETCIF